MFLLELVDTETELKGEWILVLKINVVQIRNWLVMQKSTFYAATVERWQEQEVRNRVKDMQQKSSAATEVLWLCVMHLNKWATESAVRFSTSGTESLHRCTELKIESLMWLKNILKHAF